MHLEARLLDVQVLVETGALAPLRDERQLRLGRAAHEQQDVDVPRLPAARTSSRKTQASTLEQYM